MKVIILATAFTFCVVSAFANTNQDNRANQLNPNNDAYWQSRGYDERPNDWQEHSAYSSESYDYSYQELNNHSSQLNDNNDAYWQSRGYAERPGDWEKSKLVEGEYINSIFEDLIDFPIEIDSQINRTDSNQDITTKNLMEKYVFNSQIPEIEGLSSTRKTELANKITEMTIAACHILYRDDKDLEEFCELSLGVKTISSIDNMSKFYKKVDSWN